MAEKVSTLILKVDLDCQRCYREIRKILCRLQDEEKIRTISFDEKNKTVTVSGPFDPQKLSKKLSCKAGKVIKDIEIKEKKDEETKKEKNGKPKESKPVEPTPTKEEETKPSKPVEPPEPAQAEKKENPKPPKPEKDAEPSEPKKKPEEKPAEPEKKPEDKPAEPEKKPDEKPENTKIEPADPPKTESVGVAQPVWQPGLPYCCPTPRYEGYYGGCRCGSCGRIFSWGVGVPPGYNGGGHYDCYKVYNFFSEEDPSTSCSIM